MGGREWEGWDGIRTVSPAADAEAPHTLPPPAIGWKGASCGAAVILDWGWWGGGGCVSVGRAFWVCFAVESSVCHLPRCTILYYTILYLNYTITISVLLLCVTLCEVSEGW